MARNPRGRGGPPPRGGTPAKTRAIGAAAETATGSGVSTPPVSARSGSGDAPKKAISAGQFAREVRSEARKITWPSRGETWVTSVMVFIMVVISAAFFALTDGGISFILQYVLQMANRA